MPRMLVMNWDIICKPQNQKVTVITSLYIFDLTHRFRHKEHLRLDQIPSNWIESCTWSTASTSISQRIPRIWNGG